MYLQMYTQVKGRRGGGGRRSDLIVNVPTENPFQALATAGLSGSGGSTQTESPSSSGGSLSQLGRKAATCSPTTSVQGHVDQTAQHLPTTPQRTRTNSSALPCTPPSFPRGQAAQKYSGSPQTITPKRVSELQNPERKRSGSNASQKSDNRPSPRRPSFTSSLRSPSMSNPNDAFNAASMSGVPEYLAVSGLAFRQGQYDHGGSRNRVPPNPFAKHFDPLWEEYFKLGATYGGAPATLPSTASPSHENFAWPVLINTATQDLEHPNGSYDMNYAHDICIMGLTCMKKLIEDVCKRGKDWRKTVCDIPAPVQQALTKFPDLRAHYEHLKQEAREALGGGIPMGYSSRE
ncbi:hypothetical protein GMOD_00004858 [Pyrenophora seminiperda CCB06]|uniref:Uncharacterized protein n=1 Tax=Pyrenophora seminiperda CCB06 TaxID=1302712 RepID=A0A3M7MHQ1_9PLEO|nr:hypothetical protein GMOD_00004858 [Pyrenophora seminiperda CCB06]